MSTIISLKRTVRDNDRRVGGDVLCHERISASVRLYVVVAALLAFAFAAIAIRGFAPALAVASTLTSDCRTAPDGCTPAAAVIRPSAGLVPREGTGGILATTTTTSIPDRR